MKTPTITAILKILDECYPFDGRCFLNYDEREPWQLLFATILSAQCTDARVNLVTAELFKKFPTLQAFATVEIADIEAEIYSTGFYRAKARSLQESARRLIDDFGGELPSDIDTLTSLGGVGRKTANVVRGHIFKIPSVVVDTHVGRISRHLGFSAHKDPVKVENDLMRVLPESCWIKYNQQAITHGREICRARNPLCGDCPLAEYCTSFNLNKKD